MTDFISKVSNTELLNRIYRNRSEFYNCQPELFHSPGIKLIAEKKLKKTITLARAGVHLFLRYDPALDVPFEQIERQDPSKIDDILNLLSVHFNKLKLTWNEPYIYFYKLDSQLPDTEKKDLEIRLMQENEYHEMNKLFPNCTEEDIEEADICIDEPDPVIFCGFLDDQIVSYVSHRYLTYDIADIGILIHPAHRRKGYGLTMVSHDIKWCIDNNKIPLYTVRRDNTGSISLIRKLGFTPLIEVYRLSP